MANLLQRTLSNLASNLIKRGYPLASNHPSDLNAFGQGFEDLNDIKDATVRSIAEYSTRSVGVYACVNIRAHTLSQIPLKLYKLSKDGVKTPVISGSLYDLLKHVNPFWTFPRLLDATEQALCYHGEAFWVLDRSKGQEPQNIWWAHPEQMTVVPGKQYINGYKFFNNGQVIPFRADEVVWFSYFNPTNEFKGLSPIRAAQLAIDTSIDAMKVNRKFFRNGMHIGGIINPKEGHMPFSKDQVKQLEEDIARRFSGADKAHRFMVLSGSVDAHQWGINQRDAEFLNLLKWTLNDICRVYKVPPTIVQDFERSTYCLPAYTRIATSNRGSVPISELTTTDEVWTVIAGKQISKKIIKCGRTGNKPLLELSGIGRTIRATGNHPFLVRRLELVPMPAGTAGGYYRDGKTTRAHWSLEWTPADKLRVGDTIVSAYHVGKDHDWALEPRDYERLIGWLEFLGAYTGDGSLSGCHVSMAMPPMDRARHHYEPLATTPFQKMTKYGQYGVNYTATAIETAPVHIVNGPRSFSFSSILAVGQLHEAGVCGTAKTKRIPPWVFTLPAECKLAYLRGVVDSDGYIDFRGHVTFGQANLALIKDLWHLCLSLGMRVSKVYYRKQSKEGLPNPGKQDFYDLWWFKLTDLRDGRRIGTHDLLYQKRLREARITQRHAPRISSRIKGSEELLPEGCEYLKIQSINLLPAEDVYDVSVDGGHCFFADGFLVHNSNVEAALKAFWTLCLIPEGAYFSSEFGEKILPLFPGQADVAELDFSGVRELQEDQTEIVDQMAKYQLMGVPLNNLLRHFKPELIPLGTDGFPWGDAPLLMPGQPIPDTIRNVLLMPIKPKPGNELADKSVNELFQQVQSLIKDMNKPEIPEFGSSQHAEAMKGHVDRTFHFEERMHGLVNGLFSSQESRIIANHLKSFRKKDIDPDNPFDRREEDEILAREILPLYNEIVLALGAGTLVTMQLEIAFDLRNPHLHGKIEDLVQGFAREVNQTTWEMLKASLAEGAARGEGTDQLANRISTVMHGRITSGAETIARTEMAKATTLADEEAWRQSGVVTGKTWLTTLDGRERATHRHAHGQTVALGTNFVVGGSSGPGPGLIAAARESCNCRCAMTAYLGDLEALTASRSSALIRNGRP